MDKNVYRTELDAVRFTNAGREALTEQLMQAQNPRRGIRPRTVLAAALAAALLIGSVAAAAGPLWERYLGRLDETQQTVIDTLSQELPPVEHDGTVLTPLAAFGDEDFYYLMLEIRAPEGTVLPDYREDQGYYQLFGDGADQGMTLTNASGSDIRGNWEFEWMPRSEEENVLTAVIRLWPSELANYADGTDKILSIPGLWVQSPDKEYTSVLTGPWEFNIGAYTGGIKSRTLDTTGVTTQHPDFGPLTLDSLRLSPLGIRFHYSWSQNPEGEDLAYPGAEIAVVMKDGSEIMLESDMGSFQEEECWAETYGPFQTPIDLSEAEFIRWGDAKIPLSEP